MCTLNHNMHYTGDGPQCLPFPPEILVQVIGLLDKAGDRRNARLVCKGFAEAGLPSLTYTVNFSVAEDLLDRTYTIAEHPVVAKYITNMVCGGTQLLRFDANYHRFLDWYRHHLRHQICSRQLLGIYEQLLSRDVKELRTIQSQRDEVILLLALQRFVNLKRITFTDVPLVEENQELARPQPSDADAEEVWDVGSPYRLFAIAFRSLCKRGTNIRQLKVVGSSYAIQDLIFSKDSQEQYAHMLSVFSKLRYFELCVRVPNITALAPDDAQPLTCGGLGDLLTQAEFLLTLKLASSYWPKPPSEDHCPPKLDVEILLQGFTWQHLKHLSLRGFLMIGHEGLMGFFDRHRATLESVELIAMRILHHPDPQDTVCEAWKHLFNGLRRRGTSFQTLRLFLLQDCYDLEGHFSEPEYPAYHGDKVLKYLRQGGTNPLEPALPSLDEVA